MQNTITKKEMIEELLADCNTRMSNEDYQDFKKYLLKLRARKVQRLYNSVFNFRK